MNDKRFTVIHEAGFFLSSPAQWCQHYFKSPKANSVRKVLFQPWLDKSVGQRRKLFWPWWRHQMETVSALLALCAGNSPVIGEFPSQRPVTRSLGVFFDLRMNKRLSKPWRRRWFETPMLSLWRHHNGIACDWLLIHGNWLIRTATTFEYIGTCSESCRKWLAETITC